MLRLRNDLLRLVHTADTDKTRLVRVGGVNTTADKTRQFCLVLTQFPICNCSVLNTCILRITEKLANWKLGRDKTRQSTKITSYSYIVLSCSCRRCERAIIVIVILRALCRCRRSKHMTIYDVIFVDLCDCSVNILSLCETCTIGLIIPSLFIIVIIVIRKCMPCLSHQGRIGVLLHCDENSSFICVTAAHSRHRRHYHSVSAIDVDGRPLSCLLLQSRLRCTRLFDSSTSLQIGIIRFSRTRAVRFSF